MAAIGSVSGLALNYLLIGVSQGVGSDPSSTRLPLLTHASKSAAGTNTIVRGSSGFTPTYTVSS